MTTDHSVSNASSLTDAPTNAPRKRFFHFWRCFWLAFLVISLGYAWYCFYVPSNSVAWADDFDTAQQQAVAEGKPMVLFFTSQWCVPCRIMKRNVWADDQVSAVVNESLIPVAIDIYDPRSAATIDQYRVKATPVTVVTDSNGNVLQWKQGGISKADFLDLLVAPEPSTDS